MSLTFYNRAKPWSLHFAVGKMQLQLWSWSMGDETQNLPQEGHWTLVGQEYFIPLNPLRMCRSEQRCDDSKCQKRRRA